MLRNSDVVEAVVRCLGDDSVFLFDDELEFIAAVRASRVGETLKLIVEAKGIDNISPYAQAVIFWKVHSQSYQHSLDAVIDLLVSPLNHTVPDLFYDSSTVESLSRPTNLWFVNRMLDMMRRFSAAFVESANCSVEDNIDWITELIYALGRFILSATRLSIEEIEKGPTAEDFLFLVHQVFAPLCQICSDGGYFVAPLLIPAVLDADVSIPISILDELFSVCTSIDFSDEEIIDHRHWQSTLAGPLRVRIDRAPSDAVQWVAQNVLNKLDSDAMNEVDPNTGRSLTDMMVSRRVARKIPELEPFIKALVERGCRITHSDRTHPYCTNEAGEEALELYFDALHTLNGRSSRENGPPF
eukprot:TRINITY_DN9799_c0_g1_i1.p2 TRINITY_DN9799_c0_g1~~TRINITY_DN9799_c0_g1_i1.p2  ORF type:complete len:356 (-),score=45.62 TRINITY_DN9799_c0_g1_i1:7-1074(-)